MNSGQKLGVVDAAKGKRSNVVQRRLVRAAAVKWSAKRQGDGTFVLVNKLTGCALSVSGGKDRAGANVRVAPQGKARAQHFKVKRVRILNSGLYTVYSKLAQTKCALRVQKGSADQGARFALKPHLPTERAQRSACRIRFSVEAHSLQGI